MTERVCVARVARLSRDKAATNATPPAINRIEIMRDRVEDLRKANAKDRTLDRALEALQKRMYETELHYLSRTEMHSDDKWFVEEYRLCMNLVCLLAQLGGGGGDVAGSVAYKPTNPSVSVFQDRLREIDVTRRDFDKLMLEVEAFNKATARKLPPISDRLAVTVPPT
ncbi:MAG TPA: hypothetical protein VJR92_01295 [Gemmatimonadaceae bacterium]|nr:hypothetical protein [Gemmatimonadaceae bacterium]